MAQKEWVRQIFQIVLVVNDVEEVLENWKRDVEFDQSSISCGYTDLTKYAEFDFGGVDLKLVEPRNKDGYDTYARALRDKGQGFHHIGIYSDDYTGLMDHFKALGFSQVADEEIDDVRLKIFNFEKETGLSVGIYDEMFGPCAR